MNKDQFEQYKEIEKFWDRVKSAGLPEDVVAEEATIAHRMLGGLATQGLEPWEEDLLDNLLAETGALALNL